LLFLPAVQALCRRAPSAKIDLLLSPLGLRVLRTVNLKVRGYELGGDHAALESKLRARNFDYAIDLTLRGDVDARAWLERSGATARGGFVGDDEEPNGLGYVFGVRDDRVETHTHWSRFCIDPLRPFGIDAPDFELEFRCSASDRAAAAKAFGRGPRLLLVPGGQDPAKCWPKERFIAIGRAFAEKHRGHIVVSGAPWERAMVREVALGIGSRASTFTGRSLARVVALVERCDLLVGNDTGPVHYGFFMKKLVLSIFSRMSPEVWGPPYPDPRFSVLRAYDSNAAAANEHWSKLAIERVDALLERSGG
jgi:ADP-heptose:LPS heptosyltransferase